MTNNASDNIHIAFITTTMIFHISLVINIRNSLQINIQYHETAMVPNKNLDLYSNTINLVKSYDDLQLHPSLALQSLQIQYAPQCLQNISN